MALRRRILFLGREPRGLRERLFEQLGHLVICHTKHLRLIRRKQIMSKAMSKTSVIIHVPRDIKGTKLGEKYLETATKIIHAETVLRLFEQGEISSGYGAELLGITRYEFMMLLGKRGVPFFNYTAEELEEELQAAQAGLAEPTKRDNRK